MNTTTRTLENGLANLNFARTWLDKLLDSMTDEQMMHQPVSHANHAMWIMGHLAWCDASFRAELANDGTTVPAPWKDLFGYGSTPSDDPGAYPPASDLRNHLRERRAALLEWIEGFDDAKLEKPLPEGWTGFAPNFGAFLGNVAAHEAMHVGQLSVIRKSLGMKPAMM